jgi:hypothetical protein
MLRCKHIVSYVLPISTKTGIYPQNVVTVPNMKFMKILSAVFEMLYADGRTDKED